MSSLEAFHERHVAGRRARVLSQHLAQMIPFDASLLDVGCGDGEIAWMVGQMRPDLSIRGVDVLVRPSTKIPVDPYDGVQLPLDADSVDVVMLVDVLHHCDQPEDILREAARVARRSIVVKDHARDGIGATTTLRLMDWVGNHRYGIALPYNYWTSEEWRLAFHKLELVVEQSKSHLGVYPWPASLLFDRALHFIAHLSVAADTSARQRSTQQEPVDAVTQ